MLSWRSTITATVPIYLRLAAAMTGIQIGVHRTICEPEFWIFGTGRGVKWGANDGQMLSRAQRYWASIALLKSLSGLLQLRPATLGS